MIRVLVVFEDYGEKLKLITIIDINLLFG